MYIVFEIFYNYTPVCTRNLPELETEIFQNFKTEIFVFLGVWWSSAMMVRNYRSYSAINTHTNIITIMFTLEFILSINHTQSLVCLLEVCVKLHVYS